MHIRNSGQVAQIEHPVMGFSVRADDPGAVDRKHNWKILDAHIFNDLVIRTLKKG